MDSVPAPAQILCRQCSAPLPVEPGSQLVNCEYCGTTNYVEKSRLVFHYALQTTWREDQAVAAVRRWMAGNETIKGLDHEAVLETPVLQHFPMWFVRANQTDNHAIYLEPAAAISVSELKHLTISAADLVPYDSELDATAVTATVPYTAMLGWLKTDQGINEADIREVSLVHVPVYFVKYNYKDRRYTAVVDGASGRVFANIFPAKWEVPYLAIGAAAFAAFFCAALIPAAGYLINGGEGATLGGVIYVIALVALTVVFYSAALAISAKV